MATLESQRVSEFLAELGPKNCYRSLFRAYAPYISDTEDGDNILIDNTGLPNNIHFPLTAISNHNGDINTEVRLIYVTQQSTGLPLYSRYCSGNVIDVSTLTSTIYELKNHGINPALDMLTRSSSFFASPPEIFPSFISTMQPSECDMTDSPRGTAAIFAINDCTRAVSHRLITSAHHLDLFRGYHAL